MPGINISEIEAIWEQASQHTSLARESRPPIENLVLEGGGVKGFAYIGALEVLQEKGVLQNLKRVAGSSAGGIVAMLLALGCEPPELLKFMSEELDLKSLLDPRNVVDPTRIFSVSGLKIGISDLWNLFENKGLYKGDAFVDVTKSIITKVMTKKLKEEIRKSEQITIRQMQQEGLGQNAIKTFIDDKFNKLCDKYYIDDIGAINFEQLEKLRADFPQLGFKELFITGTRLSNATLKVFSAGSDPKMSIVDAVRATMSFPFAFEPVLYQGEYFADGGIASNYPMDIFNADQYLSHGVNDAKVNPCTLGLLVDSDAEIESRWGVKKNKNNSFKMLTFAKKILKGLHGRADDLKNKYSINSIQINDNKLKTLNFSLTEENIAGLIKSGRSALQHYVDYYMSDDVIYSNLPSYEIIHDKYYSKKPEELKRIIEQKLWPSIQEINTFINLLKKVDFSDELINIDEQLQSFTQYDKDEQFSIYLQIEEMANELDNLENEKKKIDKNLKVYEIKKRNILASIDEAVQAKDKAKFNMLQQGLIDLLKKMSIAEEHKQTIEHEHFVINESYLEIVKSIKPSIFDLIEQKQKLNYLTNNHVLAKLRNTESILQEHLDIALHALSGHKRDYPDPRVNENFETQLYDLKDQYFNEVLKIYRDKDHLDESILISKAKQRTDFFADVVQFGIAVQRAKALTQHFYALQDIYSRDHKHPLLDMQNEVDMRKSRNRFFRNLLTAEMERLKLLKNTDSSEYEEVFAFWEEAVNTYLLNDENLSQGYAEYLAKEKTIKHWQALMLKKRQQEYKTYNRDAKHLVDIEYTTYLNELSGRLGQGKWGNDLNIVNRQDLKHNLMKTDLIDGHIEGNQQTEYYVSTVQSKMPVKGRYKGILKNYNAPVIKANILVPKREYLQNPIKKTKEMIILFNEPKSEGLLEEFSLAGKYTLRRKKQFSQFKDELIKKIIWSLREMQVDDLQPEDAKIKLTISGTGLAGQDAQYLFAAVIDEMNKKVDIPEFAKLHRVELVLTDPARVSESLAEKTAIALRSLKVKKPDLQVRNYNLIHQRQLGARKRNRNPSNYLGQANILSKVNYEDATVIADFRDPHDSHLQYQILTNQKNPELIQKELNESKLYISHLFVRKIGLMATKLKDAGKFLCFQFIPKFANFLADKVVSLSRGLNRLLGPLHRVAWHFKKKEKIEYTVPAWTERLHADNGAHKQHSEELPQKKVVDPLPWQDQATDLIKMISPSERLKREVKPPIENIVLEGGGLLSYGYLGALNQLKKDGLLNNLKRVAGSSGGGVVAALFAMGYTSDELSDIFINKIRLKDYLDEPYPFANLGTLFEVHGMEVGIGSLFSLFINKGLYKGDSFKKLIEKLIEIKLEKNIKAHLYSELSIEEKLMLEKVPTYLPEIERNKRIDEYLNTKLTTLKNKYQITQLGSITFIQADQLRKDFPSLDLKELFLTGTKVSDASLRVFSAQSDPNMPIADAVRITTSFPGGFIPVKYNDDYFVDGSVASNYPMHIFDEDQYLSHGVNEAMANPCTLGLIIENQKDIESRWGILTKETEDLTLPNMVQKVLQGMHNRLALLRGKYNINSVQISDDISQTDNYAGSHKINFNLNKKAMRKLIENGKAAMAFYREQYNSSDIQYAHEEQYDTLMQKYADKSIIQLERILTEEVNPLLDQIDNIEPELRAKQLSLQHHLNQLEMQVSSTNDSEAIDDLLNKIDTATYQLELARTKLISSERYIATLDEVIVREQKGRSTLLATYNKEGSLIPPDVLERTKIYNEKVADLQEERRIRTEQIERFVAHKLLLESELKSLQDALNKFDAVSIENHRAKLHAEQELLLVERVLQGKSELMVEANIIRRALMNKGVRLPNTQDKSSSYFNRTDALLLSANNLKAQSLPQLVIHTTHTQDISTVFERLFSPYEWDHYTDATIEQFRHKLHVDEQIEVTTNRKDQLRVCGFPITKLSQLANAFPATKCHIVATNVDELIRFIQSLHRQGLDIARINSVQLLQGQMPDLQQIIHKINNERSTALNTRTNQLK